jgi:hypothetical protein
MTLTGGNSTGACVGGSFGMSGPCELRATVSLGGIYSFNYSYLTSDVAGPAGDIFGVIVDGVHTQISDPVGAILQAGLRTFTAMSSFGFFVNCTVCIDGAATATITNFSRAEVVAVPGPVAGAGLPALLGFAGVWFVRRRARQCYRGLGGLA